MSENLLTVAALRTAVEAEMIRGKLEAAGIGAVLFEPEKAAEGPPTARVQVQVGPSDFERAMQLLFPIPKARPAAPSAKAEQPPWKCQKCGEQVLAQFTACWSCGVAREGGPAPAAVQPTMPAASAGPHRAPPPPLAPRAAAGGLALPPETIPRISLPASPSPPHELRLPPPLGGAPSTSKPAMNGDSSKAGALPTLRRRTADDDALKIVIPAWDAAASKTRGAAGQSTAKKAASDADDRAARRAWWTAVVGILLPPLLIYSMGVVLILGLTNRPLSERGNRFFFGALAVNALVIAALFGWLGMRQ